MQYSSAEQAIKSLGVGKKLDRRSAVKRMKQVADVMGVDLKGRGRQYFSECLIILFKRLLPIMSKPLRVAQLNGTNRFVVFSDVYHVRDSDKEILRDMKAKGAILSTFIKHYPKVKFEEGYKAKMKIHSAGYKRYYRGTLHGFII